MSCRGPGDASLVYLLPQPQSLIYVPRTAPNLAWDPLGTPHRPDDVSERSREGGLGRTEGCGTLSTEL